MTPSPITYFVYDDQSPAASPPHVVEDIAYEMEVVDELVRTRAENLPDWTDEDDDEEEINDDDENTSESITSSSASSSPRSESSFDEWSPSSSPKAVSSSAAATATKRRTRPYGRSSEDKKSRKKEQNKNAATRYRQKKKAEVEIALDEERELQDVHAVLQTKCADVQREIKYLKGLMRELYSAKNQL